MIQLTRRMLVQRTRKGQMHVPGLVLGGEEWISYSSSVSLLRVWVVRLGVVRKHFMCACIREVRDRL